MLRFVLRCAKQMVVLQLTTFSPFPSKHIMSIDTEASNSPVKMRENNVEATEVSRTGWDKVSVG